jgi:hypothetical protein
MIVTFIYKNKNSGTKYFGKYIGYLSENYEEGLDRELANIYIYNIVKEFLNLNDPSELIIGILGFNRETRDYFSEEEARIFDLLYCNWTGGQEKEVYLNGKFIRL